MTFINLSCTEIKKARLILAGFILLAGCLFSCSTNVRAAAQSNAYDYYVKAGNALPKDTFHDFDYDSSAPNKIAPFHSALERSEAVLKANARTLELLRQGFAFKYKKPFISPYVSSPFNVQMRQIARVLKLESQIKGETGDWAGAASSVVDGIRFGQDISHGSMIDMLVGRSIQSIVSKNLPNVLTNVNAVTAQNVAKRLENILLNKVQYADVLEVEKQQGLWKLGQLTASPPDWRKQYPTTKSFKVLKNIYIETMDGLIANARLPYSQRKAPFKIPADPINQMMLGIYSGHEDKQLGVTQGFALSLQQTKNVFILVEFALRAYQLEHGKYPETLKELTPDYLQKVPGDPFAANQPLLYKCGKETYTLYSIGPDGKDDGGKSAGKGFIQADTKGDIVAGVKNW